ncbi:MAG TPA: barstar family protein [Jatrophihabitans sp.]
MGEKQDAIREIFARVQAPAWAAPNLDGLVDVLRDLTWLPEGPVVLPVPDTLRMADEDRAAFLAVLRSVAEETQNSARPVRWVIEC